MDAIFKRVSVREFSKKPVKKKLVKQLLKAAMAAPSAGNQQPWGFVVVNKPKLIKKLSECSPYAKPVAKAPVSIVMTMQSESARFPMMLQQDMGACAENILLEATELGLGSVWQGIYPIPERMNYIAELLDIPEGIVPFAVITIGYPKKGKFPKQQDRYDKKRVSWNGYKAADEDKDDAQDSEDVAEDTDIEPKAQETADAPAAGGWRSATNAAADAEAPVEAPADAEPAAEIAEEPAEAEPAADVEVTAEELVIFSIAAEEAPAADTPAGGGWRSATNAAADEPAVEIAEEPAEAEPAVAEPAAGEPAAETEAPVEAPAVVEPAEAVAEAAPTGWRSASNATL